MSTFDLLSIAETSLMLNALSKLKIDQQRPDDIMDRKRCD